MKTNRIILIMMLIGTFLLNSTTLYAWTTQPASQVSIQQVLSKKDQAIIEKFDNARKWIENQKPVVNQFFANSFVKFKNEVDRIIQEILLNIQKINNRNHTQL